MDIVTNTDIVSPRDTPVRVALERRRDTKMMPPEATTWVVVAKENDAKGQL
jgi:hypothetical protein